MTTVLVVDDSPVDRKIAGGILKSEGVKVSYATNGQEALDQMAAELPDFVLTDMQMPVMDGLELVRQVKKNYPWIPVILITRAGSEEIAAEALQIGAASYLPKRHLKRDLGRVLETVLTAVGTLQERERVRELLQRSESYYVLGYDKSSFRPLINELQDGLAQTGITDQTDRLRIGTALVEALTNAIDHGNLELDSKLRENEVSTYHSTGAARIDEEPYRNRRVHVTARFTIGEATFIIRDEGPGFDPETLPDPTDPENLSKSSGRGVMMMRTFMDEVRFNESGNEITMVKRKLTS